MFSDQFLINAPLDLFMAFALIAFFMAFVFMLLFVSGLEKKKLSLTISSVAGFAICASALAFIFIAESELGRVQKEKTLETKAEIIETQETIASRIDYYTASSLDLSSLNPEIDKLLNDPENGYIGSSIKLEPAPVVQKLEVTVNVGGEDGESETFTLEGPVMNDSLTPVMMEKLEDLEESS